MQEDWRLEIEQVLHGLRMKEKVSKCEILLNMNNEKYNKINILYYIYNLCKYGMLIIIYININNIYNPSFKCYAKACRSLEEVR